MKHTTVCVCWLLGSMPFPAFAAHDIACPPMPDSMTKTVRDFISHLGTSIGVAKTTKAAEVSASTEIAASTVFGKFPNADRIAVVQTMAATYCSMLTQSGLSKQEMLSKWEVFQEKRMALDKESSEIPPPRTAPPAQAATPAPTPAPSAEAAPTPAAAPPPVPAAASAPAPPQATASVPRPAQVQVTAPSSPKRFSVTACGSVKDHQTGREWYVGPDQNMHWDQSVSWAESLSACGGGWRMPKTGELRTLFTPDTTAGTGYFTGGKNWPAHLDPAFSKIGGGSWVWSDRAVGSNDAESYNFNQGLAVHYAKGNDVYSTRAFAVR